MSQKLLASLTLMMSAIMPALGDNWITQLNDSTPLTSISIPGSHDAATGDGFTDDSASLASIYGLTQSIPLDHQWDEGVRAFDLRPAYKADADGRLQICHSVLETKLTFKEALDLLKAKLAANPGEFAIITMRHEDDTDNGAAEWAGAVSDLLACYDDILATYSPSLTVGDMRGKILILTRNNFSSPHAGFIRGVSHSDTLADQQDGLITCGDTTGTLLFQDFYDSKSVERKLTTFKAMLDHTTANPDAPHLTINHASGYIDGSWSNKNIAALANGVNTAICRYIDGITASGQQCRAGIVMMDFAGDDYIGDTFVGGKQLVDKIISLNAR